MSEISYNIKKGQLTWGATHYTAVSGPHGQGSLPIGSYTIEIRHAVINHPSTSYTDSITNNNWFIPITPLFNTTRRGFGIHPDGNIPGTLGCIGLTGIDAGNFWTIWNKTPMAAKPTTLHVN